MFKRVERKILYDSAARNHLIAPQEKLENSICQIHTAFPLCLLIVKKVITLDWI